MQQLNQLTPAEAERLALLAEEMGEAVQAIGKILRHGYESRHPDGGPTNREVLEREVTDVFFAANLLVEAGELIINPSLTLQQDKQVQGACCRTCEHWKATDDDAQKIGAGRCSNVPLLASAVDWDDEPGLSRVAAKHKGKKAFVQDASGWYAELLTLPDFCCTQHKKCV